MVREEELGPQIEAEDIEPSFVPKPFAGLITREVDDELIVIDQERGGLQHLDRIGALVWDLFDGDTSIEQTADELSAAFHAPRDVVLADVLELARGLGRAGLLDGVAMEAPKLFADPRGIPEGTKVKLPKLATLDDGTFSTQAMRGRRYVLINWSPSCGFCVGIASELVELHEALVAAGVDLVLLCASDRERNKELADTYSFPFRSALREGAAIDDDPFPGMGTPSAYLVDEKGKTDGPVRIGAIEVPAMLRELAGIETPTEEEQADGPKFLPAGGGTCAPGATPVEYAASSSFLIGEWHVGIKAKTVEADEIVRALLKQHLADDVDAPGNFSVTLDEGPKTALRSVNMLNRGSEVLVRSNNPARVLAALLQYLSSLDETGPGDLLRTAYVPLVGPDGRAMLLGRAYLIGADAKKIQPYLHRAGLRFADVPWSLIDVTTNELVVPEPTVPHDAGVIASVETPPSATEPARVLPGRYPLHAWVVRVVGDGIETQPRATSAANVLPYVDSIEFGLENALDALIDLFGRVPSFASPWGKPKETAKALIEISQR